MSKNAKWCALKTMPCASHSWYRTRSRWLNGADSRLLVLAELLAHDAAHLADRGVRLQGRADRLEQVAAAVGDRAQLFEPGLQLVVVAVLLEGRQPLDLLGLGFRVDAKDVDVVVRLGDVLVDADDDVLTVLVALVVAPGRLLDLRADVRDALDRAAQLLDLVDQLLGTRLDLVRQRFDEVRAGERVDRVGGAGLVGDDLLRPQRDPRGTLGRKRERLVEAVR